MTDQASPGIQKKSAPEFRRSLARTVVVGLLIVSLIPVLIIGVSSYFSTRQSMLDQAKNQLDTISQNYVYQLTNLASSRSKALDELNSKSDFDQNILTVFAGPSAVGYYGAAKTVSDYLDAYITTPTEEIFNQLSIITTAGTVIASTNPDLVDKVLSQDISFMALYQSDQNVLLFDPGGLFPNQLVLVTTKLFNNPLGGPPLTFIGFSTSSLLTDTLRTSEGLFANSHAYFITSQSQYAAYNPVQSTVSQVTFSKAYQTQIAEYVSRSGSGATFSYKDRNSIPVTSEIRKIEPMQSSLVIEVPDQSVYGQLSSLLPITLILLAGSLAIIGLIIGLGARSIVVPLVDLAKHAQGFAAGDWNYRVDVKRKDEIGLLGYSFNIMVQQLTDFYHSLEQRVEERTHQMRQATEIAQEAVTAASTRSEILQRAVKSIGEKFGYHLVSVYLMDESGQLVVLAEQFTDDPSKRLDDLSRIAVQNETLVGWVAKNNQPRLEEHLPATKTPAQLMHMLPDSLSELVIPLVVGNNVEGVLDLQGAEPGTFDSESVTIFGSLANQISAGLRNVQMVEASSVNLQQATSLYRSTRQISKAKSKDEVNSYVTELFTQTNYVCFFMDVDNDQLRLVNLVDPKGTRLDQSLKGFTVPFSRGISRLSEGINIFIENLEGESEFANLNSYFSRRGCKSAALIPVMEGKVVSHVIALGSRERIPITPLQIQPLSTAAEAIGSSLERIRLEGTLGQREKALLTLGAISKTTSNENNLAGLLARLHSELKIAIGEDIGFAVALYRPENQVIEVPYYIDEKQITCQPYPITNDLFSTMINKGDAILLGETSIHGLRTIDAPDLLLTTQSFIGVPLKLADEVIGAMAVLDFRMANRFTQADQDLLQTIAPQVSTNIRNSELMTAQQEALKAYDQERFLLNSLLGHTPDRIEFKDAEGQVMRVSQAALDSSGIQPAFSSSRDPESGLPGETDQEIIASGTSIMGSVEKYVTPEGTEHWELVSKIPLRDAEGNVNGLMNIARDITDLKLTEQVAERRASQLLTAADIARDTSSGSQNINELLRRLVDLVRSRFGFYHSSIFLLDAIGQFAVLKESTGEAGEALKQKGHKLAVGSESIIGQTTMLGEPVLVNDVTAEQNYYPNPMLPETKAELGIPLINSGQVIGALDVQSVKLNAFTTEDVRILQVLADQLAVAIQNSELYTRTESSLARHRVLHQITSIAGKSPTIDDAIRATVDTLHLTMTEDQITYWIPTSSGRLIVKAFAGLPRIEMASTILSYGERAVGVTASERRAIRLTEPSDDPTKLPVNPESKSLLAVPVIYQEKILGILNVENLEAAAYDETDQEIITTLANNLASIFANIQLVDQVRLQVERQRQLYDITSKIRRSVDIETIMQTSVAEICNALNIKHASIEITGGIEKPNGSHPANIEKEKEHKA